MKLSPSVLNLSGETNSSPVWLQGGRHLTPSLPAALCKALALRKPLSPCTSGVKSISERASSKHTQVRADALDSGQKRGLVEELTMNMKLFLAL